MTRNRSRWLVISRGQRIRLIPALVLAAVCFWGDAAWARRFQSGGGAGDPKSEQEALIRDRKFSCDDAHNIGDCVARRVTLAKELYWKILDTRAARVLSTFSQKLFDLEREAKMRPTFDGKKRPAAAAVDYWKLTLGDTNYSAFTQGAWGSIPRKDQQYWLWEIEHWLRALSKEWNAGAGDGVDGLCALAGIGVGWFGVDHAIGKGLSWVGIKAVMARAIFGEFTFATTFDGASLPTNHCPGTKLTDESLAEGQYWDSMIYVAQQKVMSALASARLGNEAKMFSALKERAKDSLLYPYFCPVFERILIESSLQLDLRKGEVTLVSPQQLSDIRNEREQSLKWMTTIIGTMESLILPPEPTEPEVKGTQTGSH